MAGAYSPIRPAFCAGRHRAIEPAPSVIARTGTDIGEARIDIDDRARAVIGAAVRADGALAFRPAPSDLAHAAGGIVGLDRAAAAAGAAALAPFALAVDARVAGRAEADAVVAARAKGLVATAGGARGQRALVAAPAGGADALAIRAGAVAGAVAAAGCGADAARQLARGAAPAGGAHAEAGVRVARPVRAAVARACPAAAVVWRRFIQRPEAGPAEAAAVAAAHAVAAAVIRAVGGE